MISNVISTGSLGNAVIVNNSILIDVGVPFKSIKKYHKDLSLVLLTHIHTDHFRTNTIQKLAFERPTLRFGCCEWLVQNLVECGVKKSNIDVYDTDNTYDYGLCKVTPVKLIHNVPNCGYKIHFSCPNEKMVYATDTNELEFDAEGYDLYLLEANYDENEMQDRINKKIENGIYPYEYEVVKNHLSKQKCDDFLSRNAKWYSEFRYMHQHIEKENREED